jgi:hypothetical protein
MQPSISVETNFIATLLDRRRSGIYAHAYCPVCGQAETSHNEKNEQAAISASTEKVRKHMQSRHHRALNKLKPDKILIRF